jgi:hypothetical protein
MLLRWLRMLRMCFPVDNETIWCIHTLIPLFSQKAAGVCVSADQHVSAYCIGLIMKGSWIEGYITYIYIIRPYIYIGVTSIYPYPNDIFSYGFSAT